MDFTKRDQYFSESLMKAITKKAEFTVNGEEVIVLAEAIKWFGGICQHAKSQAEARVTAAEDKDNKSNNPINTLAR